MPYDIPNWLALVLSVAISLSLVRYSPEIDAFFSKSRESKVLKRREKALKEYFELKKMHDDQIYMQLSMNELSTHNKMFHFFIIILLLLIILDRVFSFEQLFSTQDELTKGRAPYFYPLYSFFTSNIISKIIELMAFIWMSVGFTMSIITHQRSLFICRTILGFAAFEAKVKAAWPDAFADEEKPPP
jgi:hypothetical protein